MSRANPDTSSLTGQSAGSEANTHVVPDHLEPVMHLLYRPGHYDILYDN